MENRDTSAAKAQTQGLIARLAGKFGVEPNRLLKCLTTQVFKQADGRAAQYRRAHGSSPGL